MFARVAQMMMVVGSAAGISASAVADAVVSGEDATFAVRATFVAADDDAPAKVVPAKPAKERKVAPWDRPKREVPAELREAKLPTYYMYEGRPVAMRVDGTRVLARFAGTAATAEQAVRDLGIATLSVSESGVSGYVFIHPMTELVGEGGVNAAIELLLTDPRFEYAAPVYHNPEIAGGFIAMMPEVSVRVSQANATRAVEAVMEAAKGARIVSDKLAGLIGAMQIQFEDRNGFSVLKQANELALNTELAWACPTIFTSMDLHVFTPNDDSWGDSSMWGWFNDGAGAAVFDMDCDADGAWELTRGDSSVIVLCLDLGSEQDHPDLNQLPGQTFTDGSVNGFGTGDPVTSCDKHGTPVAGIISGRINNNIGGAGVCPNCRALSAKVGTTPEPAPGDPCGGAWGGNGAPGNTLDLRLANALVWGEGQNARISNGSYGIGESDLLTDTYNDTAANGMLHFASSGNGGADGVGDATVGYPARLASVQAVGGIDSDGGRSSFSNYGTGLDFSAPGNDVRSTDRTGSAGYTGSDYTDFNGTSAASPFAAGCAALIWAAYPHFDDSTIVNLMRFYATDLGSNGYDTGYGWGFPNVNDAIRAVFPTNNWCDQATNITGSAYNPAPFSTSNASEVTEELNDSCVPANVGVSHSVWYRYVVPCDGDLSINTNGSDYDTVLSVYVGSCTFAIPLGCDDDGGVGTQSQLTNVDVQAGQVCYIKVSAYGENGAGGQLDFNLLLDPTAHNNDACSDAFDIPFNQLTLTTCTLGATTTPCEGNEPCEAGNVGTGHSVWYQFHTPSIGRFNLDTIGSAYDTVLSVWRGTCGSFFLSEGQIICVQSPLHVACNDDAVGTQSRINNLVVQGNTTYRFKIAAYGTDHGGDTTFHFQFVPCPADFNLSGAVSVQDLFDFLEAYFAGNPSANFNNFGGITVQDLFDFLAAFFAGCDPA